MSRRRRAGLGSVVLVLASLALFGCGKSHPPKNETVESLATALGCPPIRVDVRELYVGDQAQCSVGREDYYLLIFQDQQSMKTWLDIADNLGEVNLVGSNWVIQGTAKDLVSVQKMVGGKVK